MQPQVLVDSGLISSTAITDTNVAKLLFNAFWLLQVPPKNTTNQPRKQKER